MIVDGHKPVSQAAAIIADGPWHFALVACDW